MTALLLITGFAIASDDCTRPTGPESVPDGATAGFEAMQAANQEVSQFVEQGTRYTECLLPKIAAARLLAEQTEDPVEKLAANLEVRELTREHDSMVDEMEAAATAFNVSIRAFNARDL